MVMERGKLRPLLLLRLMLSQDITIMVTLMDMAMVMDTMVMERGKLRPLLLLKLMLNQDIIIMATLMDMVTDMATMDMATAAAEADAEPGYYHHGYSHGYG